MDLKITSEQIANLLLVELLKKLTDSFNRMGREFYVIGATARDIIIRQLVGTASGRKTKDLDIAIAIPDWSVFSEIKERLVADGFQKSQHMHQRFYYGEYEVDVVPYGIAKEDDNIYWPPEDVLRMAFDTADTAIYKKCRELKCKMGAAVTVALIIDDFLYYAWQGNVRLYKICNNGEPMLLTTDHVIAEVGGTFLTRCVNGKGYRDNVPIKQEKLEQTNRIYICSDGFYQNMDLLELTGHTIIRPWKSMSDDSSLLEIQFV